MIKKQAQINTAERPPIIAVMGHIDHGKSTLLDYIRKSNVVEGEAGGITQHLSSYEVVHKVKSGPEKTITFLDTPGHAAFSAMRGRSAGVADIIILIVSAEDGVQAQTKEALKQIKEAKKPFVVAITKTDKPNANIERTKSSLIENEIYLEGMGGDISYVPISSKTGEGIDDLLDVLLLVAEVEELSGDASKPAEGTVIESHLDSKKGTQATLIITDGTLNKGEFIVVEDTFSPVRAIENSLGKQIASATFSTPIQITGFNKVPRTGARFLAYSNKKEAEATATAFSKTTASTKNTFEERKDMITVPIVIKSDVLGTLEAVEREVLNLSFEHAQIKIL
ncbi:MAG TPA: GTP-binding protein, partial [Candidatus Yonathbacteria bacterium]|nr:GTP-binding protein [Candidatus Yonathbacteria bacterium]